MTSGKTNRIIFFGTEDFSAIALRELIAAKFDVVAVITKPDRKKGRGHRVIPPIVKRIAEQHAIPVWQPEKLRDCTAAIKALQPVTGVLVSFGKIIPQTTIDLFTPGIINVHPSLLPHYRGPSPIESAILNGDSTTGVSIMQLSAAMDAGPVYGYSEHTIDPETSAPQLYETLGDLGAAMLVELLPGILDGSVVPQPQDDQAATYCSLLTKADSVIDWSKPAAQIEREIRAYQGWPGSRTTLHGTEMIITAAHVETTPERTEAKPASQLSHQCGDSALLIIDRLKPVGKKEMPVQAFLAGRKNKD